MFRITYYTLDKREVKANTNKVSFDSISGHRYVKFNSSGHGYIVDCDNIINIESLEN